MKPGRLSLVLLLTASSLARAQVVPPPSPPPHGLLQTVQCGPTDVCTKYDETSRPLRVQFHPTGSPATVLFEEPAVGYFDNFRVSFWLTGGNDQVAFDYTYASPTTSIFALYPGLSVLILIQTGNGSWITLTDQEFRPVGEALWSVHSMDSKSLQASIDANTAADLAETVARKGGDSTLDGSISAEATTRAQADSTLSSSLAAETAARKADDAALASSLSAEAARAQGAEGTLSVAIDEQGILLDDEVVRATGVEATLSSSIAAEIVRAQGKELELSHKINDTVADSFAGAQAGQVLAFTSGGHIAPTTVTSAPAIEPTPPANPLKIATLRWWTDKREIQFELPGDFDFSGEWIAGQTAFDGSQIWITDSFHGTLIRMRTDGSPNGSAVSANVPQGWAGPWDIFFDGVYLWATAIPVDLAGGTDYSRPGYLLQFVATNGAYVGAYPIAIPHALAFDGRNLWVAVFGTDPLCKIDLSIIQNAPTCLNLTFNVTSLATDGVYLWAAATELGQVKKIDVKTNAVVASYAAPGGPVKLVFDGANMWASTVAGGLLKIRASDGQNLGTFGSRADELVFDGASIWAIRNFSGFNSAVTRIRASDGAVIDSIGFGSPGSRLSDIVFDGISVWAVNVYPSNGGGDPLNPFDNHTYIIRL